MKGAVKKGGGYFLACHVMSNKAYRLENLFEAFFQTGRRRTL